MAYYQNQGNGGYNQNSRGGYNAPQGQGGYNAPQGQGGYNAPQGQGGYNAPQGQGGYNAPQGQGGYNAPQGQGSNNQNQGQQGDGAPGYAEVCKVFRPSSDAPLNEAFITISVRPRETNFAANFQTGADGRPFLSVKFDAVVPDSITRRLFGDNMVRPDHIVPFQTTLSNYEMDNFIQHPPFRNQTIIVCLRKLELISFQTKSGPVTAVKGSCWGVSGCGNPFKKDGTMSKRLRVFDVPENYTPGNRGGGNNQGQGQPQGNYYGQGQGGYNAPSQGMAPGVQSFQELDADDDELPF